MNNSCKDYIGARLQNISAARRVFRVFAIFSLSLVARPSLPCAQDQTSIPEEIEWTWEVRPQLADPKLPNVLLLGDSITRSYFPEVTKDLSGIANVYLLASSTSVGDPRLPRQIAEFAAMQGVAFAVVHFNNGSHGWGYTEAQFKSGFPIFLQAIRELPGQGKLIWTTITPVKPEASNGATNPRIDARNAVAQAFIEPEKILVDDLHALMTQHADLYEDAFHFNKAGSAIMGDHAAAIIRNALESSRREQRSQR
jgi:lysophospholipase L1-like esterase